MPAECMQLCLEFRCGGIQQLGGAALPRARGSHQHCVNAASPLSMPVRMRARAPATAAASSCYSATRRATWWTCLQTAARCGAAGSHRDTQGHAARRQRSRPSAPPPLCLERACAARPRPPAPLPPALQLTVRALLPWARDNLLKDRPELFMKGDSV